MTTEFTTLTYAVDQQLAIITLNRPKSRNSLNSQLRAELCKAINLATNDDQVRVVVLAGEGKGFCAGADLAEQFPDADQQGFITHQIRTEYNPVLLGITESPKPFICAVNGAAAGIGSCIAMACDLVVMAEDAFLYCAFGAIGLIPDGGCHWQLARYLGTKKAYEMIIESQRLTAQQCQELGMVNRVVASDQLLPATLEWARSLAQQAPLTMQYSKQILRETSAMTLEQTMDKEAQIQDITYRSEDFKEGARAFMEKRSPEFSGK